MNSLIERAFAAIECHPTLGKYVHLSTRLPDGSGELRISDDRTTLSLVKDESEKVLWSHRLIEAELGIDPHTRHPVPSIDTGDIPKDQDLYASTPLVSDNGQAVAVSTWRKRVCVYHLDSGKMIHLLAVPIAYDIFPLKLSFNEKNCGGFSPWSRIPTTNLRLEDAHSD